MKCCFIKNRLEWWTNSCQLLAERVITAGIALVGKKME